MLFCVVSAIKKKGFFLDAEQGETECIVKTFSTAISIDDGQRQLAQACCTCLRNQVPDQCPANALSLSLRVDDECFQFGGMGNLFCSMPAQAYGANQFVTNERTEECVAVRRQAPLGP